MAGGWGGIAGLAWSRLSSYSAFPTIKFYRVAKGRLIFAGARKGTVIVGGARRGRILRGGAQSGRIS